MVSGTVIIFLSQYNGCSFKEFDGSITTDSNYEFKFFYYNTLTFKDCKKCLTKLVIHFFKYDEFSIYLHRPQSALPIPKVKFP